MENQPGKRKTPTISGLLKPHRKALAVGLIAVMLVTVTFYLWFVNRGRRTRETSVL